MILAKLNSNAIKSRISLYIYTGQIRTPIWLSQIPNLAKFLHFIWPKTYVYVLSR